MAEYPNVQYRVIDVEDHNAVSSLIEESDVVVRCVLTSMYLQDNKSMLITLVSLLPATLHPTIAELCIKFKKHLVTASYTSSDMALLDARLVVFFFKLRSSCYRLTFLHPHL